MRHVTFTHVRNYVTLSGDRTLQTDSERLTESELIPEPAELESAETNIGGPISFFAVYTLLLTLCSV